MFHLSIFALNKEVFVGKAKSVSVPAVKGRMQILPEHIPLITPLAAGDVVIEKADGAKETIPVVGGILEVKKSEVVILAEF